MARPRRVLIESPTVVVTAAVLVLAVLGSLARAAGDPAADAVAAARRGDVEQALRLSDDAVRARPQLAAAWTVRGYALSTAGRKDEAADAYGKAAALDAKDVLSRLNRASVLLAIGRTAEALASADDALRIAPNDGRANNHRGVALERLGRLDEARLAYRAAIRSAPKDAVAHNNLGALAFRRGADGPAAALFSKAVELDPAFEAAALNVSIAMTTSAQTGTSTAAEDAILKSAERAGATDKTKARAKGVLAARSARAGKWDEAKARRLEQVALDADDPAAWNDLAVAEDQLGLAREALTHLGAALELRPEDDTLRNNMGVVHVHRGDLSAAEQTFREILRGDSRFHRAWHNLGVVLGARGDRAGSATAFRRAAELAPQDGSTVYNLAILARDAGGDRASERAAYERALALDPLLVEPHLSLGTLLADPATPAGLRDEASARVHLRRFLELVSADDVGGRKQANDWLSWLDATSHGGGR
jgi:Flp pilus assembly protein TadD